MTQFELPPPSIFRACSEEDFARYLSELTGSFSWSWADLDVVQHVLLRRLPGYANSRPLPLDTVGTISSVREVFELCHELQPSDREATYEPSTTASSYVHLREWRGVDMPHLHAAVVDPVMGPSWRFQGSTPSIDDFGRSFGRDSLATQIVALNDSDAPIGSVACYSPSFENGWSYVAFQRCGPDSGAELMFEGIFLFIAWVFETWPFRKLYAEIGGDLASQASSLGSLVGERCGTMPEHTFVRGAFRDVHLVAFNRDKWSDFFSTFSPLFKVT